jgi:pyruvate ferredoxin oxidoreductase alpha subunit
VRAALAQAKQVVVLEKSLAVGLGGIVSTNVRTSYTGNAQAVRTVIAGLGGRPITRSALERSFTQALDGTLDALTFLDLDRGLVDRALTREREVRRSGPIAENILRDLGVVGARIR